MSKVKTNLGRERERKMVLGKIPYHRRMLPNNLRILDLLSGRHKAIYIHIGASKFLPLDLDVSKSGSSQ